MGEELQGFTIFNFNASANSSAALPRFFAHKSRNSHITV
jgi:hypothetical protein